MGLLSNLKSNLTGDWATVAVHLSPARPGQPAQVAVDVTVKEKPIQVEGVVAKISCSEVVDIPGFRAAGAPNPVDVTTNESLFGHEVRLAGPQELAAGSQQRFTGQLALPAHVPASMRGRNARIEWRVLGAVEMKGNDPDSGWQEVTVGG